MDRDAIVRKLNALKAKFEHKTTGEAEAVAAMAMYNKLMQKYKLTETDLNLRASGVKIGAFSTDSNNKKQAPPMNYMVVPISKVTETYGVFDTTTMRGVFVGTMADVQYAEFLWTVIQNAFNESWKAFRYSFDYTKLHRGGMHGKTIRHSFDMGFMSGMTGRLNEMAAENAKAGTGEPIWLNPVPIVVVYTSV